MMHMNADEEHPHTAREAPAILIVEDEMLIGLAASAALEEHGYRIVDIVATAESAIDTAARRRPDLVLMDITLRGEPDGIAAARLLKARFHLPVLFVTAHADAATMERAKAVGPVGYLVKPYSPPQLAHAVAVACRSLPMIYGGSEAQSGPTGRAAEPHNRACGQAVRRLLRRLLSAIGLSRGPNSAPRSHGRFYRYRAAPEGRR